MAGTTPMEVGLSHFGHVVNSVGLVTGDDQFVQCILCLLGESTHLLQQLLLDRGVSTCGGDGGIRGGQGGAELDAGGDVVLAGHVDGHLCLDADFADIVLILDLGAGFQLCLGEDAKLFVQCYYVGCTSTGMASTMDLMLGRPRRSASSTHSWE